MKLPRDITGMELAEALAVFGYVVIRQTGSHLQMATTQCGEQNITVPRHNPMRVGTLSGIIGDVAEHFGISRREVLLRLFGPGK